MSKIARMIGFAVLAIVGLTVLLSSAYVVREGEQVVVTQFRRPVAVVDEAGLHFKTPFVQEVRRFDKRILEFDGDQNKIPTNDKKLIFIDTFARWRISDPEKFLTSVRTETEAQSRLDDIIDSATRTAIASHQLVESVRNTNQSLTQDKEIEEARRQMEAAAKSLEGGGEGTEGNGDGKSGGAGSSDPEENDLSRRPEAVTIEVGREAIMREILESAKKDVEPYGIELVDVRIKRINYGSKQDVRVRTRVYERMSSERQQIAQKYRSEGEEKRSEWLGRIEREKNQILSEAYRKAEETKGEGEAEAARIYARAYGRNPEFYRFWRTLQIYVDTLGENSTLVISTGSDFFQYLRGAGLVPPREGVSPREGAGSDG